MPDSDYTIRRRFRASCTELERAGADEDTAQLVASIVSHLEQRRQVRLERAERILRLMTSRKMVGSFLANSCH